MLGGMGIASVIDVGRGRVTSRAEGVVTAGELRGHQGELRRDERFASEFDHLLDLRGVTRFDVTTAEVREISRVRVFGEGSRLAVVAASDVGFGLSRMYEAFGELGEERYRVFRDMDSATEWLSGCPGGRG